MASGANEFGREDEKHTRSPMYKVFAKDSGSLDGEELLHLLLQRLGSRIAPPFPEIRQKPRIRCAGPENKSVGSLKKGETLETVRTGTLTADMRKIGNQGS